MKDSIAVGLQKRDDALRLKIEEYIARSRKMMSDIDSRISRLIAQEGPILVWGTGQLTMKLLAETSLAHASICAFVDNNPINHGKKLHGRSIIRPQELEAWDVPILISTLLHHHNIARQIREIGLKNEIVFLQGEVDERMV